MMMAYDLVILMTFSMVILHILMTLYAALFSLLFSASCAGVAAAAGEVAKDEKHLGDVKKVRATVILFT